MSLRHPLLIALMLGALSCDDEGARHTCDPDADRPCVVGNCVDVSWGRHPFDFRCRGDFGDPCGRGYPQCDDYYFCDAAAGEIGQCVRFHD